ncbi:MAG: diol dehydratase small subunit [Clostridiaceae bacterium]|jgi:propanediol dehydratase small subunit|nr:diol dehydratase small subunit [Clostridiaceae bacterium]
MADNVNIEQLVKEVLKSMGNLNNKVETEPKESACSKKLTAKDYPLAKNSKDLVKTKTGKGLDNITIESVLNGSTTAEDIKITADVLGYQAEIAESVGRPQFAKNLRRAAELTIIPDNRVLEIYNSLRPYRSTKAELLAIADELESKYNAKINSALVREAAEVYEKRGRLKV